jgi:hypothetical protein
MVSFTICRIREHVANDHDLDHLSDLLSGRSALKLTNMQSTKKVRGDTVYEYSWTIFLAYQTNQSYNASVRGICQVFLRSG